MKMLLQWLDVSFSVLAKRGFKLTKCSNTNHEVMKNIRDEENLNLLKKTCHQRSVRQNVLGVSWDVVSRESNRIGTRVL